jgi:thiamine-phosphate pyrophosphorylase
MEISKLQYITNYQSNFSHLDQVKAVINSGIRWIQYRPKYASQKDIMTEGKEIANLCKQHRITFIMNDSVYLAQELDADGVHLGKKDMSPDKAREILGNKKIIGGTSNTTNDIANLIKQGVNYVGLGPYTYTKTKENLSPVLGIEGYKSICSSLEKMQIGIPVIAIGGIKEKDITPLMNTGVYGIAVSSVLSEAYNITEKVKIFHSKILL